MSEPYTGAGRFFKGFALFVPVLLASLGCGGAGGDPAASTRSGQPDLLLVSVDTLRSDHLGCYGYIRKTSAHIDALAAGGTRFETAYSPMGTTGPAHASLFTSRHPLELGMVRNGMILGGEASTLAEVLSAENYATAGFASTALFAPRLGLHQGFAHWDAEVAPFMPTNPAEALERNAGDTVDAALGWLEKSTISGPLFLFVHFFDPHEPYSPPGDFARRFFRPDMRPRKIEVGLYDGEVLYVDGEFGRLLDGLNELRTERPLLVALTADHGQAFWEHDWTGHNAFTYEEELRIPLILQGPGVPEGLVVEEPVHTLDILPTLLSLLGIEDFEADTRRGLDLSPRMTSGSDAQLIDRPLLLNRPLRPGARQHAGRPIAGYGFGLRVGNWKYFEARDEDLRELYNLETDPGEKRNLAGHHTDLADEYSGFVEAILNSMDASTESVDPSIDPESVDSLRRLGYLGDDEE